MIRRLSLRLFSSASKAASTTTQVHFFPTRQILLLHFSNLIPLLQMHCPHHFAVFIPVAGWRDFFS